jgi:hypothetical protein
MSTDQDTFTVSTNDMRRAHRYLRSEKLFAVVKRLDGQLAVLSKENRAILKLRDELWLELNKHDIDKEDFD